MYKCQNCGKISKPGEEAKKVVTAIRLVQYPEIRDEEGKFVRVPVGQEIAQEITVCLECAKLEFEPEIVGQKVL